MRYYTVQILNEDGSQTTLPNGEGPAFWTSFSSGKTDLGALQVELDIPVTVLATPISAASITIWGVSLATIGQASDFNGKLIKVYGGMQAGLPLANPKQGGLLLQGLVQQAYGNWVGTSQWVRFIVTTNGVTSLGQQLNLSQSWKKGQLLSDSIKQTLAVAAPGYTVSVNISPSLVLGQNEPGYFGSLFQFAQYLETVSIAIMGNTAQANVPAYSGVQMLVKENTITITDGTSPASATMLAFTDLVGQPTWVAVGLIQVTTVMRADLQPQNYITLPTTQITTAPQQALARVGSKSIFQGSFLIQTARHIGNFRQPDASAWITAFDCTATTAQPASNG